MILPIRRHFRPRATLSIKIRIALLELLALSGVYIVNETRAEEHTMELQALTDKELFACVQIGNQSAFVVLVERYKNRLFNVVLRLLTDREEAEDVVQETFLRLWQHRQRYDTQFSLSTWIYTIALNLTKNELRKRKRIKFFDIGELIEQNGNLDWLKIEPASWIIHIEKAIQKLPVKYKTVVLLRNIENLPYEEIARVLNVPVGTVKSRVNRAHLLLQEELRPHLKEVYALSKGTPFPIRVC